MMSTTIPNLEREKEEETTMITVPMEKAKETEIVPVDTPSLERGTPRAVKETKEDII